MEGVPGQIPAPADHPSGGVTITEPRSMHAPRLGHLCLRCAAPAGPEPLGAAPLRRRRDGGRSGRSIPGTGSPHPPHRGYRPGPEHGESALRSVEPPVPGGRRVTYGGVGLPDRLRRDLLERRVHVAPPVPRERQSYARMPGHRCVLEQRRPGRADRATLYALAANIAEESRAGAPGGPVLMVDVYDAPGDCGLRGTDNMQMRFASGLPHASICAKATSRRAFAVHSRGAAPRRAARPDRPGPRPGGTATWSWRDRKRFPKWDSFCGGCVT